MGNSGVTHPTASGWQAEYGGAVVRRPEGGSESALGSDLRGMWPEAWDPTGGAVAGGPGGHSPRVCGMGGRVAWGKKSATGLALWGGVSQLARAVLAKRLRADGAALGMHFPAKSLLSLSLPGQSTLHRKKNPLIFFSSFEINCPFLVVLGCQALWSPVWHV